MRINIQNNVPVENAKIRSSKFNRSYVVETTASVGEVQPFQCRFVTPDTSNSQSFETLVRTAPMVNPAFGRQKLKKWHFFVPMESVMTMYPHMMAQEQVVRNGIMYDIKQMPRVDSRYLSLFCLQGAKCTIYFRTNGAGEAIGKIRTDVFNSDDLDIEETTTLTFSQKIARVLSAVGWRIDGYGCPKIDIGALFGYHYPDTNSSDFHDLHLTLDSGNINRASFCLPDETLVNHPDVLNLGKGYNITDYVTPEGADVIFERDMPLDIEPENGDPRDLHVTFCFRFSSWGQRFAKILRCAGIPVMFGAQQDMRRFEGLLAQWLAYYSIFGVPQYENFEQSRCYDLIHRFDIDPSLCRDFGASLSDDSEFGTLFKDFFVNELGEMWLTENPDFVSAHTRQPVISPEQPFTEIKNIDMFDSANSIGLVSDAKPYNNDLIIPIAYDDYRDETMAQPDARQRDGHSFMASVNHSWLDSELLKRFAKYANRNTIGGRVVAKLLDLMGLGDYMNKQSSNFLGFDEIKMNITSLTSQSDTYNPATGDGLELGEYGGKCVAYEESSRKYKHKSRYAGYYISFFAITIDASYMQSCDETTRCATKGEFYNPDADGLGLQLNSMGIFQADQPEGSATVVDGELAYENAACQRPYGYAPRYSTWKIARSFINGGFADRSRRNYFTTYDMNKLFYVNQSVSEPVANAEGNTDSSMSEAQVQFMMYRGMDVRDIPVAGKIWRYLGRYPWFENFSRVFSMKGKQPNWSNWARGASPYILEKFNYHVLYDENYIIQIVVTSTDHSNMLPIDEGYGTIDLPSHDSHYEQRS